MNIKLNDTIIAKAKPSQIPIQKNIKILHLTLHKQAFDVMITGEKKYEFRKDTPWIRSRLIDKKGNLKKYDYIKFTNGYGNDKPYFICQYFGFTKQLNWIIMKYSNGLEVNLERGDFVINCGSVIQSGNLKIELPSWPPEPLTGR